MGRKTLDVRKALDMANEYLANSTVSRDMRLGVASFIESILHTTDNYAGYVHLETRDVPAGQWPGIMPKDEYEARGGNDSKVLERLATHYEPTGPRVFPDDSRRFYIIANNLKVTPKAG